VLRFMGQYLIVGYELLVNIMFGIRQRRRRNPCLE